VANTLRIALVTSSYNYIADGVALTLNRLVGYLERQGVEVLVFTPTAEKPAFTHNGTIAPVPSMPLPGRPEYRFVLRMPARVKRKLLDFKPDIIHIAVPDFLGHAVLALANANNIPAVATYHTRYETYLRHYWYLAPFEGLLTKILRRFYGACREVYVPSDSTRDVLLADGLKNNFKPWPRGIETDRFNPAKRSAAWRTGLGIGQNELVVLHVSRLVREKRLDMLTAALKQVTVPHRVVIVGDGPDRPLVERELPHAIFTGFAVGDALTAAYASSDIFFFPSDSESFGNVTLEAMASGLPCVCADATGSRSLVMDGQTGFLAPANDPASFARHITALIQDAGLRQRMGQAARARALSFSWDETLARMLGYYRALLDRTASP
jgi:phosphatidylinositol alpha 1,6-mannosyltransferase